MVIPTIGLIHAWHFIIVDKSEGKELTYVGPSDFTNLSQLKKTCNELMLRLILGQPYQ